MPTKSSPNRDILQPNPQITHQIGLNDAEWQWEIKLATWKKVSLKAADTDHAIVNKHSMCLTLTEHICPRENKSEWSRNTILSIISQWRVKEQCHGKQRYIHHTWAPCGSELACFKCFIYLRKHTERIQVLFSGMRGTPGKCQWEC